MNQEELISVIVPVYNVADYLPRCMETVLGQTYKNLEIIFASSLPSEFHINKFGRQRYKIKSVSFQNRSKNQYFN